MTESEVKKERKDQFGSPEIRQERNKLNMEARSGTRSTSLEQTNMVFFDGDMAISISFKPPDVRLPRVIAKARTAEELTDLRTKLKGNDVPFIESAIITRAGIGKDLGGVIDETAFPEFANALQKMS